MAQRVTPDVQVIDETPPGEEQREYLPATGNRVLLPLYDPLGRLLGFGRFYRRVAALAGVADGERVLDVGCGTGGLSLAVLGTMPGARVVALDPDLEALRRAARTARRRGVGITLVRGFADRLPAGDASLDHVVSSLALHHVPQEQKETMATELVRVLRPGGRVTIADFDGIHGHGVPHGASQHDGPGGPLREELRDVGPDAEDRGGVVRLLSGAGLNGAGVVHRERMWRLPVAVVQARKV